MSTNGAALLSTWWRSPADHRVPTGGWMLTQCDRAVLAHLSLGSVLTHCAAAPTTQPVDVPGSSIAATLEVRATIPRILAGTTDCTAAPEACVVGLVRLAQHGSDSVHLAPVSFGSAG